MQSTHLLLGHPPHPPQSRALSSLLAALFLPLMVAACQPAPSAAPSAANSNASTHADNVAPCPADATVMQGWDERAPPRRIFGNTWYVGTCGLTALLITSEHGHVLIDGATEAAGPLIEANIRALGFNPTDVEYLLNSHEHYDHAAGLAYLQRMTGAPVLARAPAVTTLQTGRSDRRDPQQLEPHATFPAISEVRPLGNDGTVRVGGLVVTAHATPGHTPGGTSWTWRSCEGNHCWNIAYTDSISAISDHQYRYMDHPEMVAAFREGLETMAGLPCDIHIAPHPLASNLSARLGESPAQPLVQPGACAAYAAKGRANLEQRLADERSGIKP